MCRHTECILLPFATREEFPLDFTWKWKQIKTLKSILGEKSQQIIDKLAVTIDLYWVIFFTCPSGKYFDGFTCTFSMYRSSIYFNVFGFFVRMWYLYWWYFILSGFLVWKEHPFSVHLKTRCLWCSAACLARLVRLAYSFPQSGHTTLGYELEKQNKEMLQATISTRIKNVSYQSCCPIRW